MDQIPITLSSENGIHVSALMNADASRASKLLKWLPALGLRGLGFLTADGLSWGEKLSVGKFLGLLNFLSWNKACQPNETVENLLRRFKQSEQLQQRLWNPLCIATMNTVPNIADASTFCRVLKDSLGSPFHAASDFLFPKTHLGAALAEPALEWLAQRGCDIQLRRPVNHLVRATSGHWVVNDGIQSKNVILAIPPSNAFKLLKPLTKTPVSAALIEPLNRFIFQPIATIYLGWKVNGKLHVGSTDAKIAIPKIYMLDEDRAGGRPGQWLFDRGIQRLEAGVLAVAAVVVSAWDLEHSIEELGKNVANQIASIRDLHLPRADYVKVIVEKRATIACTVDRPKFPSNALAGQAELAGIWLAGDYTYFDYPATLEGSVRSGRISAEFACATPPAETAVQAQAASNA
jgi:hydroxysqualene dehydroxylase